MNKKYSYINQNSNVKVKKEIKDIHKIGKLYENMTYFSQYGFSIFLFIFITLILLLICCFCYLMVRAESIRADWTNQRCHPYILPFAGFINKPDNMSVSEFTQQNFDFCNQTIFNLCTSKSPTQRDGRFTSDKDNSYHAVEMCEGVKSGAGEVLKPLTYITNTLANETDNTQNSIQNVRAMFNKTRTNAQTFSTDFMSRLLNGITPLQNNVNEFKNTNAKLNNVLYDSLAN